MINKLIFMRKFWRFTYQFLYPFKRLSDISNGNIIKKDKGKNKKKHHKVLLIGFSEN